MYRDLEKNQETIRAIYPNHFFIARSLTNNALGPCGKIANFTALQRIYLFLGNN